MTIIVEDGGQVSGANSYVSLADARTLLADYGQDLDADDTIAEQQLLSSMRYIEAYREQFKGYKLTREQSLQWPRGDVYIDGWLSPSDEIPVELPRGQVFAAYEIANGESLQANDSGRKVSKEKVDVIEVAYFESSATEASVRYTRVDDELSALLDSTSSLTLART